MFGIEKLNNTGIHYIGNENVLREEKKTLIVIGVARSGTSLIAGSLSNLGVYGGEKSRKPVFEDVLLANAFEEKNFNKVKEIIETYNENDIWAFKRPSSVNYLDNINKLCRNPVFLIVFKDIFSIANRNRISMRSDISQDLVNTHAEYSKIVNFISKKKPNAFLFSYEKIMGNTEAFVETLIHLLDKNNVSEKQKEAALNFIEPNPKDYLNASRITRSIGRIGSIDKNRVVGWGKYVHSNEPAIVELYINNELIESKLAEDFRPNILEEKQHPTGNCGYIFNLNKRPLKKGDMVAVKLKDDVLFLSGSKVIFGESN